MKQESPVTDDNERGVHVTPVHGSRERSVEEARVANADAPAPPPAPSMVHEIEGTSIVVENKSGIGAAEDTGILRPDNEAAAGETAGSG